MAQTENDHSCAERKRRRNAFVETETFQQAGVLQSLPQPARRTRQARTLLSMYVHCCLCILFIATVSSAFCLFSSIKSASSIVNIFRTERAAYNYKCRIIVSALKSANVKPLGLSTINMRKMYDKVKTSLDRSPSGVL